LESSLLQNISCTDQPRTRVKNINLLVAMKLSIATVCLVLLSNLTVAVAQVGGEKRRASRARRMSRNRSLLRDNDDTDATDADSPEGQQKQYLQRRKMVSPDSEMVASRLRRMALEKRKEKKMSAEEVSHPGRSLQGEHRQHGRTGYGGYGGFGPSFTGDLGTDVVDWYCRRDSYYQPHYGGGGGGWGWYNSSGAEGADGNFNFTEAEAEQDGDPSSNGNDTDATEQNLTATTRWEENNGYYEKEEDPYKPKCDCEVTLIQIDFESELDGVCYELVGTEFFDFEGAEQELLLTGFVCDYFIYNPCTGEVVGDYTIQAYFTADDLILNPEFDPLTASVIFQESYTFHGGRSKLFTQGKEPCPGAETTVTGGTGYFAGVTNGQQIQLDFDCAAGRDTFLFYTCEKHLNPCGLPHGSAFRELENTLFPFAEHEWCFNGNAGFPGYPCIA